MPHLGRAMADHQLVIDGARGDLSVGIDKGGQATAAPSKWPKNIVNPVVASLLGLPCPGLAPMARPEGLGDAEVVRRGRKRLESMLRRLEKEIEEADREIGSSLNLLDQNHDGICTTEELRNAFLHVLADHDNVEADALVEYMDPTDRGYFQISDLHDLLGKLQMDDERRAIFEYIGKDRDGNKDEH